MKVLVEEKSLQDIANSIRAKNGTEETYKPSEMAGAIDAIEAGGGDSFYDAFWDSYQDYGNRTNYGTTTMNGLFSNGGWNDTTFKPKYDIKPTQAYGLFRSSSITDLTKCGVEIDFSNCTDIRTCFNLSSIVHIGTIDCRKCSYIVTLFYGSKKLEKIDKLIFGTKATQYNDMFGQCISLTDITVEGAVLATISLSVSPLTAESAKSFINCLKNYAGTDKEYSYTISFSPTTWGYLDAEGETASPNGNSWRQYINDLGWNAS